MNTTKLKFALALAAPFLGATAMAQDFDPSDSYSRNGMAKENMTLVGTVTQNPVAGYFVIRAGNGWTYRVDTRFFKPVGLNVGDRVRAYGDWKNGVLHAGNVRILRQGDPDDVVSQIRANRSMMGTVVSNRIGDEFVVRARNGWTYPVRAIYGEPKTLSIGDRVRVYGAWTDGMLYANNIRFDYDDAVKTVRVTYLADRDVTDVAIGEELIVPQITRAGTVIANPVGPFFTLREANGTTYRVRSLYGWIPELNVGDRVRVWGKLSQGVLEASNVRIAYQADASDSNASANLVYDYDTPYRDKRTLTGTVTTNPSGNRFTMRGSNGNTYAVRALSGEPAGITAGDRVRVYGAWRNGMIAASNVRMLRQGRNPENYNDHVLVGQVTENLDGDRFVVRARNGTTYRVLASWGEPSGLSVGDRVRAYGDWKEGMLHASNVRVLNGG